MSWNCRCRYDTAATGSPPPPRDWCAIDGERLHDLLCEWIEAVESLADEIADHILGFRAELPQLLQQASQIRAAIGPQDADDGLQRPRKAAGGLPDLGQRRIGCVQAEHPARVHGLQNILGIGRLQPLVELQGICNPGWTRSSACGATRVVRITFRPCGGASSTTQRFVEFPFLDRLSLRVDHILEVVEENDGAATRKFSQQGLHLRIDALLGILVELVEVLCRFFRHQLAEVIKEIREIDRIPERALR